jgi:uncharacterized membrane protein YbhN (UPF0104 family)/tRNA A-37 threonylcarbamoyl transferase component Bud32
MAGDRDPTGLIPPDPAAGPRAAADGLHRADPGAVPLPTVSPAGGPRAAHAIPYEDPAGAPDEAAGVEVVEDGVVSARLRRPLDLVRVVVALSLSVLVFGLVWVAANTNVELDRSLLTASRRLPGVLVLVLSAAGGFGLLALPVAAGVDLLVRGRGRQLFDALLGFFLAVIALTLGSLVVEQLESFTLREALAGSASPDDAPFLPLFGGLVAFVTVARLMARPRWNVITALVVGSLTVVSFVTGGITIGGVLLSLLLGWSAGLLVRYALGTPTTRPPGRLVAATLLRAGFPVQTLRARQGIGTGRQYLAETGAGPDLRVVVLDRDLEGSGLISAAWRDLRFRAAPSDATVNMRRTLEQRALLSYAARAAQAPVPDLVLASEVGPDSALLAYSQVPGTRFAALPPDELTDVLLDGAFDALARLQQARIAHRALTAENLLATQDGRVVLLGAGGGVVAAGDVVLRIDIAELLATVALLVGPQRAIAAGRRVLGDEALIRALPVLQPVAMHPSTRRALRQEKELLTGLRDRLVEVRPDAQLEPIKLERIRPRTLITIGLGTVAGYVLLSQLSRADFASILGDAQWGWVLVALGFSFLTYVAATLALAGFVPEKLRFWPTMGAQFAASFATLVTPPTLGAVAVNLRYLQRCGVHPALASASIGASQASAFLLHVLLLLVFGVAAGTRSDFAFEPPRSTVVIGMAALLALVAVFSLPPVRRRIWGRFGPLVRQIGPRLLTVVQQPRKLLEGIGGLMLLNAFYIAALVCCVQAFGGDLTVAAIGVVYLTGSVVGQAAPTPGGLGAVEAAMAAGLTAAGLDGGVAVSAVLTFRLVTFWLPTVPGYAALHTMQRQGLL